MHTAKTRPYILFVQRLQQAHTRAIKQLRNQPGRALHVQQQGPHLRRRQYHRQALGSFGLHHIVQPGQIHTEHLFVQIQKRRLGLVLGRRRNLPVHRQVRQKFLHLSTAHILRVALAVKQDKTPRPIHIGRLGANAVVARTQVIAQSNQ